MNFLFEQGVSIFVLLLVLPLLWLVGQSLFNVIWMFFPFKLWRITDVTHLNIPLPDDIAENQFNVEMLDFRPEAVLEVQLTPLSKNGQYTRLYTAENQEAYAEVTQISAMNLAGFFTLFPDNALIMTTYPYGENIQTPNFHQRYAANSLDAAYYHHTKQVERWREIHGNPVPLKNKADIDAADNIYRQYHRRRHYHRLIAQQFFTALSFISTIILLFSLFAPAMLPFGYDSDRPFVSLIIIVSSGAAFFGFNAVAQRFALFPEPVDDAKKVDGIFGRDL